MLTFDAIRDIERREKENKRLQKLPENLMEDTKEYLRKKEKNDKTANDIMELENVKGTIKRFFDLREQKITELALFTARTGMPVENLTEKERNLYLEIVENLKRHREYFFEEIQKSPEEKKTEETTVNETPKILPAAREMQVKYQVIKKTPAFVGPDMNVYELKEGEFVTLPKALNDLLLKNGIVKEV